MTKVVITKEKASVSISSVGKEAIILTPEEFAELYGEMTNIYNDNYELFNPDSDEKI